MTSENLCRIGNFFLERCWFTMNKVSSVILGGKQSFILFKNTHMRTRGVYIYIYFKVIAPLLSFLR